MNAIVKEFFDKWMLLETNKLRDTSWLKQYSLTQMFGPEAKDFDPGPMSKVVSVSRENDRQILRDLGYPEMEARWIEHANYEWDLKKMFLHFNE